MDEKKDTSLLSGDLALISKYRNALMGIAAVIICFFHEHLPVMPEGTLMRDIEEFVQVRSFYGVDIFLLLSGMSVAFSLIKAPEPISFYGRRAIRILPVYLLSGVVMIFTEHWTATDYMLNISGVRFFTTDVNSYLWFVITIIIFYLAAPWYQKIVMKTGRPVVTCMAAFVIWYVLYLLSFDFVRGDIISYMFIRIPIFLFGMLLGTLINRSVKVSYRFVFWTVIVSLFVIGWFMSYSSNYYGYLYLIGVVLGFVPTFALGVSTTYICAGILDLLKWKWLIKVLEFFGSFCFELYIVERLFDRQLIYFITKMGFTGILRNILMFVSLSLIAFVVSRLVNHTVMSVKKLMQKKDLQK